jgi:multicomponent Na+:H+ antiporter subunit B
MNSLILQTATRYLLPLLALFSVFLLLRGHHNPGGGFIGGLVAAAAITLCALAFDVNTARQILVVEPQYLIGAGMLTALASGAWGLLEGKAFLTGSWIKLYWPLGGTIDLGTPLLFDLGVYFAVIGTVLLVVLTRAEE